MASGLSWNAAVVMIHPPLGLRTDYVVIGQQIEESNFPIRDAAITYAEAPIRAQGHAIPSRPG